jgi:hypothetical protein
MARCSTRGPPSGLSLERSKVGGGLTEQAEQGTDRGEKGCGDDGGGSALMAVCACSDGDGGV